jgi:hypothetical protein
MDLSDRDYLFAGVTSDVHAGQRVALMDIFE